MKIAFCEVDSGDRQAIVDRYRDSLILEGVITDENNLEQCSEINVLCCFIYSKIGKAELDAMPDLQIICTRSVGFDHIDMEECAKRNITVCNVPDYGSHVIAEHVFALLLSASRHIAEADKRVEEGNFDYRGLRGIALKGKTIGVVGTGKIGRRVCKIAHGFGMRILAFDRCRTLELEETLGVHYVTLQEILTQSDVLTLHMPATDETEHMINETTINQMKDTAILINTARGTLIHTSALVDGLHNGKFSHVLLDVLEHEQNFEENKALIEHEKVLTTPHIAFFADDSMESMYEDCFLSIDQFSRNQVPERTVSVPMIVCDMEGLTK